MTTLEMTFGTAKAFQDYKKLNADKDFPFYAHDNSREFRTFLFSVQDENDANALETSLTSELVKRGFYGSISFASN